MRFERLSLVIVLGALGAALAAHPNQPIVENYVGRQIPTAMVARNLAEGSGFLHPTLDTAPFPHRFLVEPPIYAEVVATLVGLVEYARWVLGWLYAPPLWEASGRLTSALMTLLGGWAFAAMVRRREGPLVALVALASFGCLPVVLRYGRAFQPDAMMVGFVWLGLWAWDEYAATDRPVCIVVGGFVLSLGITIKVTAAWVLIPWFVLLPQWSRALRLAVAGAMLYPALAWYLYAWQRIVPLSGSQADLDNATIWLQSVSPLGWLRWATWQGVVGNLVVRAFTPVGFVLLLVGWGGRWRTSDRFWRASAVGLAGAVVLLGPKWHHTYYWLIAAPLAALGIARALVGSYRWASQAARLRSKPPMTAGLVMALGLGLPFVLCAGWQVRTTWSTPPEWTAIREASERIASLGDRHSQSLLVGPEALIYYVGQHGARLEFGPAATVRAVGEWGRRLSLDEARANPLAFIDALDGAVAGDASDPLGFRCQLPNYCARGCPFVAGLVADVGLITQPDEPRGAFRAAIRQLAATEERRTDPTLSSDQARLLRGRPGLRIVIDEPALFVFRPGRPPL